MADYRMIREGRFYYVDMVTGVHNGRQRTVFYGVMNGTGKVVAQFNTRQKAVAWHIKAEEAQADAVFDAIEAYAFRLEYVKAYLAKRKARETRNQLTFAF